MTEEQNDPTVQPKIDAPPLWNESSAQHAHQSPPHRIALQPELGQSSPLKSKTLAGLGVSLLAFTAICILMAVSCPKRPYGLSYEGRTLTKLEIKAVESDFSKLSSVLKGGSRDLAGVKVTTELGKQFRDMLSRNITEQDELVAACKKSANAIAMDSKHICFPEQRSQTYAELDKYEHAVQAYYDHQSGMIKEISGFYAKLSGQKPPWESGQFNSSNRAKENDFEVVREMRHVLDFAAKNHARLAAGQVIFDDSRKSKEYAVIVANLDRLKADAAK